MKDRIQKEYYKRVRQLTSSKLNGRNTIRAINSRAVSLVRYSAGILKWTKDKLKVMDRKTQKIMTMNRMYHPQNDTGRLYIPRMEGRRGLMSIKDCAETEKQNLSLYLDQAEQRLLRFSKSEKILPQCEEPVSTARKQKKEERHKQGKEKQLHGKFKKEMGMDQERLFEERNIGLDICSTRTSSKNETDKKKKIDGQEVSEKCRMCGERDESVTHLIAECKKLAQKEYKQRHDNIAKIVQLELRQKFGLVGEVKWCNHKPASVVENGRVKILWDFNIQTDHVI